MAEHDHDHDHDHDPSGCCAHSHPQGPDSLNDLDQAGQSLADALRVSFRLLTLIMILLVIAFLMTGLKTVAPNQVAIKKVFGRQTAEITNPGLIYNWPYPVGEIELIDTSEQSLKIDDFWMYESDSDKLQPELSKRTPASDSLRPGWDGVLLTGDRNLFHARLECTYSVRQGALARSRVPRTHRPEAKAPPVDDIAEAVRSAICSAAVRTAATWSADDINRDSTRFAAQVVGLAQNDLDALMDLDASKGSAIRITKITVGAKSWPLHVLGAINRVVSARAGSEQTIQSARADALNTLNSVMDARYVEQLVGDVLGRSTGEPATQPAQAGPLTERYDAAVKNDPKQAARLLEQIDAVLTRPDVGGEVSTIIQRAGSQASETVQKVNARAERFSRLLADYRSDPDFMIQRLWAQAREEILKNPSAEKIYLPVGHDRMVIYVSRDPRVINQINEELTRKPKAK